MRCCDQYIEFLERLDVMDRVSIQPRLEVPVLMPGHSSVSLARNDLPAPFHLAGSLLAFSHISLVDRVRVVRGTLALRGLDLEDASLDSHSFGSWLRAHGQTEAAIDRFWDLLARATLNVRVDDASLALAAKVFQTGILTDTRAGDIGISRVPLSQLHAEPAAELLKKLGAEVRTRSRIAKIECGQQGASRILVDGEYLDFDAVIVATPHDVTAEIVPDEAKVDRDALRALGRSPIVNLHVVFDRKVADFQFAAGVETPVQWIFDRTESSGAARRNPGAQCLAISLSAADAYVGVSREDLRREFVPQLERLFPAARAARILSWIVTCERDATFRGVPGTQPLRPGPVTGVRSLFLAGAWTDTGWPATMEGAVRSGQTAARTALKSVGIEPLNATPGAQ